MKTLRYKPRIHLGGLGLKVTPTGYVPVTLPGIVTPSVPLEPAGIPQGFRYTREQLTDMLARGASETFERSGENENGLPTAFDLEQRSREMDANKQYADDVTGEVVAKDAPKPGAGLGLIAAAIAAFLIFGG